MRLLLTADWQADWETLDLCEQAANEVLTLCDENHLSAIVVAGDLKRAYNPIDTRVIQFWMDFIHRAVEQGLSFFIDLGNHDRVGMYSEAQNWLPILQRAGATVIHQRPKRIPVGSGMLYFLPFSSSTETTRKWAEQLSESVSSDEVTSILIFHNDLLGCSYNVLGHASTARLKPSDLQPESYTWCFGGHVHLRQKLGKNVYYLGNPFCTDWGESNQTKGYTIVEGKTFRFVPSQIPGSYDPSWPGFPQRKNWDGVKIRIHVPIEVGQDYSQCLEQAKKAAEKKYAGAAIYAVPEFKEAEQVAVKVKLSDPDTVKIRTYVDETLPDPLSRHRNAIVSYLLYKLEKASQGLGLRAGGKIEFLSAKAKRFLSFEDLEIDYRQPGLRVITGKNKDWLGRSNGSGKSNYESPIPVALFGKTFKDQKHDGWALRDSKKEAWVRVKFRDSKGRIVRVERGRRPPVLQLFVDGKDQSSGLQSTAQSGTQGLIEKLSGFTWQTLANAVYIDQQQVNTFLAGTPAEQKKILERFQNLERFAKALEEIVRDSRLKAVAIDDARHELAVVKAQLETQKDALTQESGGDGSYIKALRRMRAAKERLNEANLHDVAELERRMHLLEISRNELRKKRDEQHAAVSELTGKFAYWQSKLEEMKKAVGQKVCPTCLQPVDERHLQQHFEYREVKMRQIGKRLTAGRALCLQLKLEIDKIEERLGSVQELADRYRGERYAAEAEYRKWKGAVELTKAYEQENAKRRAALERQIKTAQRKEKFWAKQIEILSEEQAIADYCVQAFSRNGVPAFLNAQICPALNKAAEHYSEVFTSKEIQVRFKMADAEFEVEVVNAHGGQGIADQSTGEKKMAAIIASFALRAVAPPCNLLVLDEPGDGLDAGNAKAFAVGLKKLKDKLGTVLLTTHNPVIAGELSGESCIIIEKEKGVSRIA